MVGRWGVRTAGRPTGQRCGFDLTGGIGARCSECGADLGGRRAVTDGRRGLAAAGVVAGIAAGGAAFVGTMTADDWTAVAPTWLLWSDLQRGAAPRALDELARRARDGRLSAGQARAVVDFALALQPTRR